MCYFVEYKYYYQDMCLSQQLSLSQKFDIWSDAGTKLENRVENTDKNLGVAEGKLQITIEGENFTVKPGEVLHIPGNTPYTLEVVGSTNVIALEGKK